MNGAPQTTGNSILSEDAVREEINQILSDLNGRSADIEASALVSTDGLTIASALSQNIDEDRVAAMSAAMLSLGDRTSIGTFSRRTRTGHD